jgi:pyridoxamine 5'-phosphate oxidase
MNGRIESLGMIQSACWRELERAAIERDHEWRVMAVATADQDGVDLRNLIVREVREHDNRLVFYTDSRSPKVAQITARKRGALLAWSRVLGWQVRLQVSLSVETSGRFVASRWERLKATAAAGDYLSPLPPGSPMEGLESQRGARGTRGYFAVVQAQVHKIDWLELHPDGHRRAVFDEQGMRWVGP